MLNSLDIGALTGERPTKVPMPKWFKPLAGEPSCVALTSIQQWNSVGLNKKKRRSEAKKAGIRYEAKARELLETHLPSIRSSLKLCYRDLTGERFCELDALYQDGGLIWLFEIKISHTSAAWWQLREFYEPIVRAWQPEAKIMLVELVKNFDPTTAFPEGFGLNTDAVEFFDKVRAGKPLDTTFQVLVWKP